MLDIKQAGYTTYTPHTLIPISPPNLLLLNAYSASASWELVQITMTDKSDLIASLFQRGISSHELRLTRIDDSEHYLADSRGNVITVIFSFDVRRFWRQ
jgi:hypothetical protein